MTAPRSCTRSASMSAAGWPPGWWTRWQHSPCTHPTPTMGRRSATRLWTSTSTTGLVLGQQCSLTAINIAIGNLAAKAPVFTSGLLAAKQVSTMRLNLNAVGACRLTTEPSSNWPRPLVGTAGSTCESPRPRSLCAAARAVPARRPTNARQAALQSDVGSDRVAEGSTAHLRAAASNLWAQGVHGLYLASWSASAFPPQLIQGARVSLAFENSQLTTIQGSLTIT